MANLWPLHDRVVIRRIEEQDQMRGIIIPDTAKEKPQQGELIAVGDGKLLENGTRVPLEVKVGDRVLFAKYAGTEINLDDEEFLIMREDEILGIIEQADKSRSAKKQKYTKHERSCAALTNSNGAEIQLALRV
jgi:chaperonin GroES